MRNKCQRVNNNMNLVLETEEMRILIVVSVSYDERVVRLRGDMAKIYYLTFKKNSNYTSLVLISFVKFVKITIMQCSYCSRTVFVVKSHNVLSTTQQKI